MDQQEPHETKTKAKSCTWDTEISCTGMGWELTGWIEVLLTRSWEFVAQQDKNESAGCPGSVER